MRRPLDFGLASFKQLRSAAKKAKKFVEEREAVVNMGTPSGEDDVPEDGESAVRIGGRTYIIEGLIGRGDTSDVYRGRSVKPFPEMVVVKVENAIEYDGTVPREVRILHSLHASEDAGTPFFRQLIPEVIASDMILDENDFPRHATVFRYKNQFDWTVADIMREYPEGVDGRTGVWIWKRVLDLLAWVHRNGVIHGAVLPPHILIHARDHGAMLLGWSNACRRGSKWVQSPSEEYIGYYLLEMHLRWANGHQHPGDDIAMSARSIIAVLGGNPETGEMPDTVPAKIADFLRTYAEFDGPGPGRTMEAHAACQQFGKVAASVYGPKFYQVLRLPRQS